MGQSVARTARGTQTHTNAVTGCQRSHTGYTFASVFVSRSPGDVLETFNFLENAEDSDEEEDEEGDLMDDISTDKHHRAKKHKSKVHTHTLFYYYFPVILPSPLPLLSSLISLFPPSLFDVLRSSPLPPPGGERGFGVGGRC